ncbi:MAG: TlpA family protein disulfide reductase [Gammaproteobacteria bacterium]
MKSLHRLFLLSVIVVSTCATGLSAADFELRTLDGEPATLNDYVGKGQWTLVMLWATDCPVCKKQKPEISSFHNKHKNSDANVIGIALDGYENIDDIRAYLREHQPSFPSVVGDLALVAFNYQAVTEEPLLGTPTYLLFNPKGELIGNNAGPLRPEAIEIFIEGHS